MQTRNLTPFLFGTKACSRRPPQPEVVLIVRGRFSLRLGDPLAPVDDGPLAQGALTAETFADDLRSGAAARNWSHAVSGLARLPLLVLTSDDGLAPMSDSLVAAVRRGGDRRVTIVHEATDHSWSDRRIFLESAVLRWLQELPASTAAR